jgi:hypothetical protein
MDCDVTAAMPHIMHASRRPKSPLKHSTCNIPQWRVRGTLWNALHCEEDGNI